MAAASALHHHFQLLRALCTSNFVLYTALPLLSSSLPSFAALSMLITTLTSRNVSTAKYKLTSKTFVQSWPERLAHSA